MILQTVNPITFTAAATNFAASGWHIFHSEWRMAVVWACYGIAASVLAFVK
jgi:hypothetical protein